VRNGASCRPPTENESAGLVRVYNEALALDGWQLVEGKAISGKPTFVAQSPAALPFSKSLPGGKKSIDNFKSEAPLDTAENEEQWQAVACSVEKC